MRLYLDASVIVPIFVAEPTSDAMFDLLARDWDGIVVSDFAAGEVASALSRKVREKRLTPTQAMSAMNSFDDWTRTVANSAEIIANDLRRANAMVRRLDLKLRFPDAIHLAACERLSIRLVTRDKLMGEAADAIGLDVVTLA